MRPNRQILAAAAAVVLTATPARAQLVVSANDAKVTLVDGVQTIVANPPPDTVTVIDFGTSPATIVGSVDAPASVIGPPSSVAVAPDESFALVTAAQRLDPATPNAMVPSDVVSVIDLRARPLRVVATVHAGAGASGVSINKAGTLALVANRVAGTVSVFSINGMALTPAGTVDLGAPNSGPSHVAISPDGRMALVTRNNDHRISILSIDGTRVEYTKRDVLSGLQPYGIEIASTGDYAVAGNIGAGGTGSADTLSVIDLRQTPPHAPLQVTVGPTAEGLDISPDGRFVATTVMNGSNAVPGSPFFHDHGLLRVLRWQDGTLTPVAEAPIGRWCQGAVWIQNGRAVVVECMVDREWQVYGFDGQRLTRSASIPVPGQAGPAGLGRAGR